MKFTWNFGKKIRKFNIKGVRTCLSFKIFFAKLTEKISPLCIIGNIFIVKYFDHRAIENKIWPRCVDPEFRAQIKSIPEFNSCFLVLSRIPIDVCSIWISYLAKFCNQSRMPHTKKVLSCIPQNRIEVPITCVIKFKTISLLWKLNWILEIHKSIFKS